MYYYINQEKEKFTYEEESKINSYLNKINKNIQGLEDYLNKLGLNTPIDNIVFEENRGIKIPTGYIRKRKTFQKMYDLDFLILDEENQFKRNICYALQLSDLYNYFINRFNITLSCGKLFMKNAIINLFSIIEAILMGTALRLNTYCNKDYKICKNNRTCSLYIKSPKYLI